MAGWRTGRVGALAVAAAIGVAAPAAAEEWRIGAGPFVSASDVRNHNRMPLDINDVVEALGAPEPDWPAALEVFAFGGNFPNHSLAVFTDDYNGRFAAHLPVASAHFGGTGFQNQALNAALVGSGAFRGAEPAVRVAFVEAGLEAVALNWARYELGESRRKALASEPNWSLENGSPKNWNEIFAFYWGPEGRHSVFEALEAVEGGPAVNAALFQALADGQEVLVGQSVWAEEDGAEVAALLDAASVALLRSALDAAGAADDAERPAAQARAAGYWLAAAEALADDAEAAAAVEAALEAEAAPEAAAAAAGRLAP